MQLSVDAAWLSRLRANETSYDKDLSVREHCRRAQVGDERKRETPRSASTAGLLPFSLSHRSSSTHLMSLSLSLRLASKQSRSILFSTLVTEKERKDATPSSRTAS